jgi:hypothetical protein
MVEILGRPYILFDPEQTEEIKRLERMDDIKKKIINGLNQALEGIDEVIQEWTLVDREDMQDTIEEAIRKLEHVAGIEFHEDIGDCYVSRGYEAYEVEWIELVKLNYA